MNIAAFSIKRPIFIASIVILSVLTGWVSLTKLGVDLFPDVNIPVVVVNTVYMGAGPEEVENLISRPLEEEISSISGLKRVTSYSHEGYSSVVAQFNLSVDIKWAEQEVRTRVARARRNLPTDVEEPVIVRFDPADQPILRLSLFADLPPAQLYDLAKEKIKPSFEQVKNVASVKLVGGTKREIQIELDRDRMNRYDIPAVMVAKRLQEYGVNVPVGKFESGSREVSFRTLGRFETIKQIEDVTISFAGDVGNALPLKALATVRDGEEDRTTIGELWAPVEEAKKEEGFFSGLLDLFNVFGSEKKAKPERITRPALFIDIYKQSGTNTVEAADAAMIRLEKINESLKNSPGHPRLVLVRDGSHWIRVNIQDVAEAIILGILLAVVVVYLFLGNPRSTIITGLALPNSMLGAFILMYIMGFTINVMTLLALSLTVGLLVDDAIVVRENIFRKLEEGMPPVEAAWKGTSEVTLAVIATTLTVIAVFFPVGFLSGMVGQFFKQFGLTVVFAMMISMFDALTVAPLLSAYFAGDISKRPNPLIRAFDRFQDWLEDLYSKVMRFSLRFPWAVILITFVIFAASIVTVAVFVKKTFMPASDQGEFMISIQMPPGTSLDGTYEVTKEIRKTVQNIPELNTMATVVGNTDGESNVAVLGVILVPPGKRDRTTSEVKEEIRGLLKPFERARPSVNDYSVVGGNVRYPLNLLIKGDDLQKLEEYSNKVLKRISSISDLIDLDSDYRTGKPEFQVDLDPIRMQRVGVTPAVAGAELRYHVAGGVVGKLHDKGLEYDIRMRLKPEQRNLRRAYGETRIPNMNYRMVPLKVISEAREAVGPEKITRMDRSRVIQIHGNLAPGGAIGNSTEEIGRILKTELKPPEGVTYSFIGEAEDMNELFQNILLAFGLALVFIYLVLSSLYESFITPITILFAIPPAISGAFFALAVTGEMINIFSMIGVILLMGLVTKNSILLVDYALEGIRGGLSRKEAIYNAGRIRLRPILMTSLAMIAGTVPIALGLGEASRTRTAMGVAIIGGLLLSTIVTLVVVPAIFGYIDWIREWIESKFRPDYDMTLLEGKAVDMAEDLKHVEEHHRHMEEE